VNDSGRDLFVSTPHVCTTYITTSGRVFEAEG
jgi:hypothetical protein